MSDATKIFRQLAQEKEKKYKNGIYYYTQTELAYNSNRIEGSRLSKEHTASLFATKTLVANQDDFIASDDITETMNHFRAFDYILTHLKQPLTEALIKEIHRILKTNTSDADLEWFKVGDYKALENIIGEKETTPPAAVHAAMAKLLQRYNAKGLKQFQDIIDFHVSFESIHPFQDGNGRVGRLILFKECLNNDIIPFIIDANHKNFYYRGLQNYQKEPGYLIDTCLAAQDVYTAYCQKLVYGFGQTNDQKPVLKH